MPTDIPRPLVEFILLGPEDDRRQLQDSPILGDVWIKFAKEPASSLDLLITPYKDFPASRVAAELAAYPPVKPDADREIAYLHGIVAARLTFEEVVRYVVPMTHWWTDRRIVAGIAQYVTSATRMERDIRALLLAARKRFVEPSQDDPVQEDLPSRNRYIGYITLAGLIRWAKDHEVVKEPASASKDSIQRLLNDRTQVEALAKQLVETLHRDFTELQEPKTKGTVWTVSLNRQATTALTKSVPAVKGDAARTLFAVDCSEIAWAIIDAGVDATHDAFRDKKGECRVKRSFDFTRIRQIISLENIRVERAKARAAELLREDDLRDRPSLEVVEQNLRELADDATHGRSIDWKLVEALVEIKPDVRPGANHGTHVAGIIAANAEAMAAGKSAKQAGDAKAMAATEDEADESDWANGMCPDIRLYDFRVLGPSLKETEFAIIAALQYIRYLNERNGYMTIHGANLSLSIPHDVRNYACGRTPVCNECERLVNSGVVVVAAAGNRGYQSFETNEGLPYEGYTAFSVTDPGNADGVITVGATHRYWPHTYGVSFFSSRGPTGDGRLKPDLVAPGERIRAPFLDNEWGDLDGTSMAAPHVSGAAAMLMARYSELIGQPRRIKNILCSSATDLGRERSFQGHGMLDVLRAFQSI